MLGKSLWVLLFGMSGFVGQALASDFLWGISTHVGLRRDRPEQVVSVVSKLGINAIRDELYWTTVYSKNGEMNDARSYADILATYRAVGNYGACLLLILDYGHPAYVRGLPDDSLEISRFVDYVKEALRQVDAPLCGIEIWNEWNIGAGRVGGGDRYGSPESYVNLVRAVVPTIKAYRPRVPIIVGALSDKDLGWLRKTMSLLKGTEVDGVSVHPYVFGDRDRRPVAVERWVATAVRDVEASFGKKLPIYVTEIGWPNFDGPGGVTERSAAQNLVEVFLRLRVNPDVAGVWWYGLKDKGNLSTEKEHNFGLYRSDFSEKLTARALRSVVDFVKGCGRGETVGDDSIRYSCRDGERWIIFSDHRARMYFQQGCKFVGFLGGEENFIDNDISPLHVGLLPGCRVK